MLIRTPEDIRAHLANPATEGPNYACPRTPETGSRRCEGDCGRRTNRYFRVGYENLHRMYLCTACEDELKAPPAKTDLPPAPFYATMFGRYTPIEEGLTLLYQSLAVQVKEVRATEALCQMPSGEVRAIPLKTLELQNYPLCHARFLAMHQLPVSKARNGRPLSVAPARPETPAQAAHRANLRQRMGRLLDRARATGLPFTVRIASVLVIGLVALSGCGGGDSSPSRPPVETRPYQIMVAETYFGMTDCVLSEDGTQVSGTWNGKAARLGKFEPRLTLDTTREEGE